jgi:DNA-binding MarR family transcriptional regulator
MESSEPEAALAVLDSLRRLVRALRAAPSGAQLFVLHTLARGRNRRLSVNELAAETLTDQSSVSVVVARLVERGLVGRRVSKEDARRVELSITAAGRATLKKSTKPPQVRLVAAIRALPPSELAPTARALVRLVNAIGARTDEPAPMFFSEPTAHEEKRRRRGA